MTLPTPNELLMWANQDGLQITLKNYWQGFELKIFNPADNTVELFSSNVPNDIWASLHKYLSTYQHDNN